MARSTVTVTARFARPLVLVLAALAAPAGAVGQSAPAAVAPATQPVLVHAWTDVRVPGLTPMIWVRLDREAAQPAAAGVAPLLRARPPGQRVVAFWSPFPPLDKRDLPKLVAGGVEFDGRFYRDFFWRLRQLGADVDRVVIDYEDGLSVWHTIAAKDTDATKRIAAARAVLEDAAARRQLSDEVRQLRPEDFASHAPPQAYAAWNRWAAPQVPAAIRRAVADSADRMSGRPVPVTNYEDVRPSFDVFDVNGWQMIPAAVGGESSPSCYLGPGGNRYRGRAKDPRWNRFIDHLNVVRSCAANGPVVPWVSPPTYDGDGNPADPRGAWLWEQLVRHLHATGVREFLYWNPGHPYRPRESIVPEDRSAAAVFGALPPAASAPAALPPLPLDADEVVTGDVVTRYRDFEASWKPK
ncbi:MAG TPA: hypothetical protein VK324_00895 [Tepidisphaeraceae bacterium]|nr:hypothetical protein [Tepidisphaeraceae bacterium]